MKKIIHYLLKKKYIWIVILILLTIIYLRVNKNTYDEDNKIINYSLSQILVEQNNINLDIKNISNSNKYTIENPKIILNPYKISPLTALIIFNTEIDVTINVNINNEYIFDMEKSKTHIIPIYGLYENTTNIITLEFNDIKKEIEIITEKSSNINAFNVTKSNKENVNDLYFMTSPVGTSASAYDSIGNLKWYLTEKFTMDFEWLNNGHFLVGIKEGEVNDRKLGFVEMDYLGKIYNYYILEHGYEFEFQVLKNGNYMLCGGDIPIYYDRAWIYEINSKTGELVNYIDLYDIFTNIDEKFDTSKLGFKIIRNAFYFNEENNELIISLRGLNSVVSIDYNTKNINYIFAPKGIYSDKFDKYMVSLESGRYPLGLHSVFLTEEGYVGFINNGYDRYNGFEVGGIDYVSAYKDDYTSAEIYEIKDKKASLIWNFDADKKYFSHQYGSFNIYDNNKLINYGWTLKNEYRMKENATLSESEKNTENTYAKIFEINENNEIILEGTIDDGKYRIFKSKLYNENMENFDYKLANIYNTIPLSKIELINTKDIKDNLNSAIEFNKNIIFTRYSLDTDYIFDEYDDVDILLVQKNKSYKVKYKKERENVNKLLNIELKKGNYDLYLIINGNYFSTNIMVSY